MARLLTMVENGLRIDPTDVNMQEQIDAAAAERAAEEAEKLAEEAEEVQEIVEQEATEGQAE